MKKLILLAFLPILLAWIPSGVPHGEFSDSDNLPVTSRRDIVGSNINSYGVIITTLNGIAAELSTDQADADSKGIVYEIWASTPAGTGKVYSVICDGTNGHAIGWDGTPGNLLQKGPLVLNYTFKCTLLIRVINGTGRTNMEILTVDSFTGDYVSATGDSAQGIEDAEALSLLGTKRRNIGG